MVANLNRNGLNSILFHIGPLKKRRQDFGHIEKNSTTVVDVTERDYSLEGTITNCTNENGELENADHIQANFEIELVIYIFFGHAI